MLANSLTNGAWTLRYHYMFASVLSPSLYIHEAYIGGGRECVWWAGIDTMMDGEYVSVPVPDSALLSGFSKPPKAHRLWQARCSHLSLRCIYPTSPAIFTAIKTKWTRGYHANSNQTQREQVMYFALQRCVKKRFQRQRKTLQWWFHPLITAHLTEEGSPMRGETSLTSVSFL